MAIEDFIKSMNKSLNAELLKRASDLPPIQRVASGLDSLDVFSGGGLPMGMPILLAGQKSSGKSAFCYHMAGNAIAEYGGVVALVQSEGGLDKDWAERCGLPIDATAVSDTIEELASALELTIRILKESKPRCLIFDSLSALPGDSKKAVGDSKSHGERAKPMNDFFRKLNGAIDKQEPPLLLFIEHLHPNIGGYGYITTGGETKGYMSVVEMRFRRTGSLVQLMETDVGEAELPIELTTAWELRKSKVSPDGGRGEFNLGLRDMEGIVAGEINDFNETLALATYLGIVQKKGAWFQIGEDKYHGLQGVRRELTTSALKQIIVEAGEAGGKETGKKSKGKGNTK